MAAPQGLPCCDAVHSGRAKVFPNLVCASSQCTCLMAYYVRKDPARLGAS